MEELHNRAIFMHMTSSRAGDDSGFILARFALVMALIARPVRAAVSIMAKRVSVRVGPVRAKIDLQAGISGAAREFLCMERGKRNHPLPSSDESVENPADVCRAFCAIVDADLDPLTLNAIDDRFWLGAFQHCNGSADVQCPNDCPVDRWSPAEINSVPGNYARFCGHSG